ncbi:hypothetical protein [Bathymodiolus japonicus methanotrophic gill symbiont]|uniref:hypothetical protein n=1 Tax=Bathymodiolus japonicus methanotrophic gill symbiont TaxID=113269 RepID=UPI001C8D8B7C|nr:hypothetical protein [Bathymodiolus japonicus methanotrophic gill symbiont]
MAVYIAERTGYMHDNIYVSGDTIVTKTKFKVCPSWMRLETDKAQVKEITSQHNIKVQAMQDANVDSFGEIVTTTE